MIARQAVWAAILAAGCAVRSIGYVESAEDDRTILVEVTGDRHPLALTEGSSAVARLDDHLVEIMGRKGLGRRIRVDAWRAIEGPHGLSVWAGQVQRAGERVAIQDFSSGDLVWVDDDVAPEIAPYVGDMIAAEGYLERDRLRVVHWLPLVEAPASGRFRP